MKAYKSGEILLCPMCGKHPAGEPMPVDDFIVPNSDVGTVEENECWECYGMFSVEVAVGGVFGVSGSEVA